MQPQSEQCYRGLLTTETRKHGELEERKLLAAVAGIALSPV